MAFSREAWGVERGEGRGQGEGETQEGRERQGVLLSPLLG